MSSITVGELKSYLDYYPDDYEVIMYITEFSKDMPNNQKHSIAYINGIKQDDDYKELHLMN